MANTRKHGDRSQEVIDHPDYPGAIRLVRWRRGPGNPTIEAQIKLPGEAKWGRPFSLKTDNVLRAVSLAAKALGESEQRRAGGLPEPRRRAPIAAQAAAVPMTAPADPAPDDRTFRKAALMTIERLEKQRGEAVRRHGARSGAANKIATRISPIRKHLIPAFGDMPVADMRNKHLNAWARDYLIDGPRGQGKKRPAANTVNNWDHAIQMVFDWAVEQEWLDADDKPSFSRGNFDPPQSRPWFAPDGISALRAKLPAWVAAGGGRVGDGGVSSDVRYLLHVYVAVVACTGIRPGEEMELIRENQLHRDRADGFWYFNVTKRKGRGAARPRDAIIFQDDDDFDAVGLLRGLLAWRKERGCKPGTPLFSLPQTGQCPDFDDPFRRFLEEHDLRTDPETAHEPFPKRRVLYSLRHYFATRQLLRPDVSWNEVAEWMGTSVQQLEQTYSKVKLRMLGARLAQRGVVKRRGQDGEDDQLRAGPGGEIMRLPSSSPSPPRS